MNPRHEINTGKVLATLAFPVVASLAYAVWSVMSAWSRLNAIKISEAQRVASIHMLNTLTVSVLVGLLVLVFLLILVFRSMTRTELGESEIVKPRLFGVTRMRWSEVVRVRRYRNGSVRLYGPAGALLIPIPYYRHPNEVLTFVDARLSAIDGLKL